MPLVKGPPRGSVQVLLEGLTAESILTTRLQSKRTRLASWSKGLEAIIPASVVHWRVLEDGWTFEDGPGVVPDPNLGAKFVYEIYIASDPNYTGRVTVPVLWDKRLGVIVNDESSEIIRMMNCAFDALGAKSGDYYPQEFDSRSKASTRASTIL